MGSTKKYFRVWLECGGAIFAGSNTPYVSVSVNTTPATMTGPSQRMVCANTNQTFTATGSSVAGHPYFWYDNNSRFYTQSPNGTSATLTLNNIQPDKSGTWTVLRAVPGTNLSNQGLKSANLNPTAAEETGLAEEGAGTLFEVKKPIQLHSVILRDAGGDGIASSDFKIALMAIDQTILYETGALTVGDNATLTVSFSNWFISPGQYMLVITPNGVNSPVGDLTISNTDFPMLIGGENVMELIGGVEGFDATALSESYNYFYDINITPYCDYGHDMFDLDVIGKPSSNGIDTVGLDTLRFGNTLIYEFSGYPSNFRKKQNLRTQCHRY
jgi:hypothetical protein